ncbi:MAG: asparagine synthase (glutamine-hydrolyzing) [Acidobacteriaceae bacterium]|nr:asparagine synthase (glutamine-hydrolyzing) [Acidobacteriaceae bacterium]
MCGISGFVKTGPAAGSAADLRRMLDEIRHRGPDGHGIHEDGVAFLGHRRLSIIDVAGGHQPMSNESGSVWITFNGEIFNHAAIRPQLERVGHRYVSRCDTETIVHAFEEYGPSCVEKFRGMFAFAIWDANQQTLFCARDRLGIKPLYYYASDKLFAFASEIKALLKLPEIPTQFEDTLLPEYLTFGYVSSDKTLFKGIRKLMPGHTLTVNAGTGTVQVKRYWDVPESSAVSGRSDEAWIRECRERLEQTVQMRLMSDVPLGMFLSGGVDSSAIAALMKRMRTEPVKTFAVGYEEAAYSELSYARQVSKAIGTDHHEIVIGPDDFFNALPRLIWHEDEPISWPSSVSLYFVSHLASQQVKVVLTGEGSDELFAGYYRYQHYLFNRRWADLYKFVPPFLRKGLRHYIDCSGLFSADLRRKLQHTFIGRDLNVESLQLDNFYGAFSAAERRNMLSGDLQNPYQTYLDYWQSRKGSVLSQMLYADQKTYLVELLMKQDQMSMACSIESRVPFLDHPFVEFASQVPDNLKIRGKTGKYIVKRAVEDLLPHEIIYRKKMGFPTPLRQWFREKKCEPLFASLLDRKGFLAEYLNLDYVRDLIGRQRSGADDATDRLWRLLNLHIWGNTFFTGKRDQNWDGLFESRLTKELV